MSEYVNCQLAWSIWEDAKYASSWIENEDDPVKRRILWNSTLVLLCSISDVLDRDENRKVRQRIQIARLRWKEQSEAGVNVFNKFIRFERNNLVHEGRHGHSNSADIPIVIDGLSIGDEHGFVLTADLYWPMESGPYEGEDARDVLKMAVDWWESELEKMGLSRR